MENGDHIDVFHSSEADDPALFEQPGWYVCRTSQPGCGELIDALAGPFDLLEEAESACERIRA